MSIRHVVSWRLAAADAAQKREDAEAIKARLEGLRELIDGIRSLEVGFNALNADQNWDLVLVGEYDDAAALARYAVHPAHQEVAAFIRSVTTDRASVDYEV